MATTIKWKLLWVSIAWLELTYYPKPILVFLFVCLMIVNIGTGVLLRWATNTLDRRNTKKTVETILGYLAALVSIWLILNVAFSAGGAGANYAKILDFAIAASSLFEFHGVIKNVRDINPRTILSVILLTPILTLTDFINKGIKASIISITKPQTKEDDNESSK